MTPTSDFDVVVVGAGFGGLAAALTLASRGARVALVERLRYPGGCASTFVRGGTRYESGATLFSGFGPGQLFRRWIDEHQLDVRFESFDPLVELRTQTFRLGAAPKRADLVERVCALDGVPEESTRRFFREQQRVASALWELFDDETLLPPFGAAALLRHLARSPRYLPVLRTLGLPLRVVLRRHGLDNVPALRSYLNAVCQITVQCGIDEVEAPFALGAMDYYFRGTGHIHGGIGELATALCGAIAAKGGEVLLSQEARRIARRGDGWTIETRRGPLHARHVIANLTPHAVGRLWQNDNPRLKRLAHAVEGGWGACMLYLRLPPNALERREAHHLQLVGDEAAAFQDGNHVFCSISSRDEDRNAEGQRTVTCSTHVRIEPGRDDAAHMAAVQGRMRATIAQRAPEIHGSIVHSMSASPRTFARFTGRDHGYVGGIPRTKGLSNYRDLGNPPLDKGLHLVGDTVFPGQSTLATALGGVKVAERVLASL